MKIGLSQLGWSFATGIGAVVVIAAVSRVTILEDIDFLLAPGMLLAAVAFPQGVEGDHANLFLIVAAALDVLFFSLIALFIIKFKGRLRCRDPLAHPSD